LNGEHLVRGALVCGGRSARLLGKDISPAGENPQFTDSYLKDKRELYNNLTQDVDNTRFFSEL